jgi:kynureninase
MVPKLKYELRYTYAQEQDNQDELKGLGLKEFCIPSEKDLKKTRLGDDSDAPDEKSTALTEKTRTLRNLVDNRHALYLCGNSLGLQPKRVKSYIASYLETWQSLGVFGHFKELEGALTVPWVRIDEQTSEAMSKIVGARQDEVTVMQTLTANLHLLMASFYRPTKDRYKIILEGKAFPSDHVCLICTDARTQ